ncbi:hypothetical protein [Achromobacter sp. NFACC18-2]|uniref:hypothetical protein n=1 Tax=Achromobacter sp. NFACC18-2 TaxID=1564112 RepID=UPI0008C4F890|nr:hypothetical protein [Achromobacter sp. NFACC18-2]SEK08537.1 hypothetical protein SAMN03159494_05017 [Achromobacter sp. NFACC18-2]
MASSVVQKMAGAVRVGKLAAMAGAGALLLGACMSVPTQRVALVPVAAADPVSVIQLSRMISAQLSNDSIVTLSAGSQWQRVGALPQGDAYRSLSGLFTIQTRRQAEAYVVASSGKLVGFYLPGESAYLSLTRPVTLPVEMRQ